MTCDTTGATLRDAIDILTECVARLGSAGDPWAFGWSVLVPIVVAAIAIIGVLATIRQQHLASRSDHLWDRMSWAIENALSVDDDVKMAGLLSIERLLDESEAKRAGFTLSTLDKGILDDVSKAALPPAPGSSP
jgi:hypothetical protein